MRFASGRRWQKLLLNCFSGTRLSREIWKTPMNRQPGLGNRGFLRLVAVVVTAAAAFSLSACPSPMDDGVVGIGLTDAPGDFLSYTLDVTSLSLTKTHGTGVPTPPPRKRVGFAR